MQGFEQQVANELNILRTIPQKYANTIREYKKYFKGTELILPGTNIAIQTQEGANAYEEAGQYLENANVINPLKLNESLCRIAKEYLVEVQKTDINEVSNIDLESIIANYGQFKGSFSRIIDFGGTTPALVIANLLVGDGDEKRSQRQSLLNEKFFLMGVASGKHSQFGQCTVILLCTEFYSKNTEDVNREDEKKVNLIGQPTKLRSKPPTQYTQQYNNPPQGNVVPQQNYGGDPDCPEGVKKVIKTENIIVEGGKRKKIIKTVKYMEDGSMQTEIEKEVIN
jgi:hypothetical protein